MKQKQSSRRRRNTKSILRLPDLEHAKAAVLNRLNSADAKRGYRHAIDEFVDWYCSEPRLAFNRIVVLRHRSHLESRQLAPGTINLRLGTVRRRLAKTAVNLPRMANMTDDEQTGRYASNEANRLGPIYEIDSNLGAKRAKPVRCVSVWPMANSRTESEQHLEPAGPATIEAVSRAAAPGLSQTRE